MSSRAAPPPPTALPAEQMVAPDQRRFLPPWPAAALMVAAVFPIYFSIGDFLLTPMRIICLLAVIIVPAQLFFARAYGRLTPVDFLITFYALWVMLSYLVVQGPSRFVFAGLQVVNILGGYMIGRAAIRSVADMQAVARLFVLLILPLLPFAIVEGLTGSYIIPGFIDGLPGLRSVSEINYGQRLGLNRAQVVFTHPIHWGLFCSLPIALYCVGLANQVPFATRVFVTFLVVSTCFTSLSSGPILAAGFQIILIGYAVVFHGLGHQWRLLLLTIAGTYAVLEPLSTRFLPYALASRMAFNSKTAHYRTLIWEYGSAQVERTPIFGTAGGYWQRLHWMPSSIDNYWLQLAVVNGLPATLSMIAVFLYTMIRLGRGTYVKGTDAYYMRVAVTILLVGLALSLSTVTIWNEVLTVVMFVIGASAFMLQAEPVKGAAVAAAAAPKTPQRRGPVYTRFPAEARTRARAQTPPFARS